LTKLELYCHFYYKNPNEHLTMQIAKQVFGLNTAQNALIFFRDGTPAYITKRFDVKADGTRWGKEYFALLETIDSDYRLSPFYDLINTGLHVDDSLSH